MTIDPRLHRPAVAGSRSTNGKLMVDGFLFLRGELHLCSSVSSAADPGLRSNAALPDWWFLSSLKLLFSHPFAGNLRGDVEIFRKLSPPAAIIWCDR